MKGDRSGGHRNGIPAPFNMRKREELKLLQCLPLDVKIRKTQQRIREWVDEFGVEGVYASFSGGKDSTVLLDIIRQMYPDIPAVFADTGLEYPAIRAFVFMHGNTTIIKPDLTFRDVIKQYGYPVIGKEVAEYVWVARHSGEGTYKQSRLERLQGVNRRKDGQLSQYNRPRYQFLLEAPFEISPFCCREMKKKPFNKYAKSTDRVAIMATMAEESRLREGKWLKNGCNSFRSKHPNSAPMSFWRENDVLEYLLLYHDRILEELKEQMRILGYAEDEISRLKHPWADCYGDIIVQPDRFEGQMTFSDSIEDYSGCKLCTTGCHRTGCIFCLFGITQDPQRILKVQKEEPKIADYILRGGEFSETGMWQPSREGLGYWFIIMWLKMHGISIGFDKQKRYESHYGNAQTRELLKIS